MTTTERQAGLVFRIRQLVPLPASAGVAGTARRVDGDLWRLMPTVIAGAVLAGLTFALAMTPIGSGDYGQWLMTSRTFLGESVPAYRVLTDVPPLVPALLAAIRVGVTDPFVALHLLSTLLLVALGVVLFVLGTLAVGNRTGGACALVVGLLVTDRLTDLFAFGGVLQLAALTLGSFAIAAIIRSSDNDIPDRRWLLRAGILLALCAVTHVGTATIFVPLGIALTGIVVLVAVSDSGWQWQSVLRALIRPGILLVAVGMYWLLALLPASTDYVTNPASIAYRGPDRLWADLFGRWPTAVVSVTGAGVLAIAALRSLLRRRLDPLALVAIWTVLAWSILGWSIISGSATDFPRFATPVLFPLVIGAAAGVTWALRAFAASLAEAGYRGPPDLIVVGAVVIAVLVAAPLTIDRHLRQAAFYELRDASALARAAAWLDSELPPGASVLADVREGKWIEGLSGHPSLFAQPVRYAFRPNEWRRSVEADALLRSTLTLTSGLVSAQFAGQATGRDGAVPTGMLIRANHRGEFVDLLRVQPTTFRVGSRTTTSLIPLRATEMTSNGQVALRTVWGISGQPKSSFTQTTSVYEDGTTLQILQAAPGHQITTDLTPVIGMDLVSLDARPDGAVACFTELAGEAPCLQFRTTGESRLSSDGAGGIRIRSNRSGVIDVLITAATAGDPSVGLGIFDPARIATSEDVRAALLSMQDPAYTLRVSRLESIGFRQGASFGPYAVLLRDDVGGAAPSP